MILSDSAIQLLPPSRWTERPASNVMDPVSDQEVIVASVPTTLAKLSPPVDHCPVFYMFSMDHLKSKASAFHLIKRRTTRSSCHPHVIIFGFAVLWFVNAQMNHRLGRMAIAYRPQVRRKSLTTPLKLKKISRPFALIDSAETLQLRQRTIHHSSTSSVRQVSDFSLSLYALIALQNEPRSRRIEFSGEFKAITILMR